MFEIATFYKLFRVKDTEVLKSQFMDILKKNYILGTVLIAKEGINATIAGTPSAMLEFYNFLDCHQDLSKMDIKKSYNNSNPFQKLKVKVKSEVVKFGMDTMDFDAGKYVNPREWDELIQSDDVILVDTRNDYEYYIGTFKDAVNPNTKYFREFSLWADEFFKSVDKNKKIAMFCTGGIRAEKTTRYMKNIGFKNVYHLKGGILNYFSETQNENKTWVGNCFIFDERVIVNDALEAL